MWWYSKPEKWTVLCADGKFRTATQTAEADTYFTVPARVQVRGKTVTGFVWFDNSSTAMSPGGTWKFTANGWMKNAKMLHWPERQRD
jgi:hypothetical protein